MSLFTAINFYNIYSSSQSRSLKISYFRILSRLLCWSCPQMFSSSRMFTSEILIHFIAYLWPLSMTILKPTSTVDYTSFITDTTFKLLEHNIWTNLILESTSMTLLFSAIDVRDPSQILWSLNIFFYHTKSYNYCYRGSDTPVKISSCKRKETISRTCHTSFSSHIYLIPMQLHVAFVLMTLKYPQDGEQEVDEEEWPWHSCRWWR